LCAKKQREPNEINKEYQAEYDEISAQKLCAGKMSMELPDMQGGRALDAASIYNQMRTG
jgi:hypothetical protein